MTSIPGSLIGSLGDRIAELALDALPCAAYIIEAPSARIVAYNQRAVDLWGRSPAAGERFCGSLKLFLPDGTMVPHDQCPMAHAIHGDHFHNFEIVVERPDGTMATLLVNISPLRDARGRITGALNVMQDITARHKADMLIRGQKQVLEMIARGEPLARTLEALARIVERQAYGRALASIFLLDAEGKHLKHGAAPSLPDAYNQAVDGIAIGPDIGTCATAAYTGEPVITEDIDKAPSWAAFKHLPLNLGLRAAWSMPIISSTGRVIGTFGTYFRECRGPSPSERETVELLAHTAALAIEWHQREDTKREADRRKDEFLAMLAHELRNPLMPIRTAASLLSLKSDDPEMIDRAHQIIERQTRNMARLLDDLLDVSRITRGSITLKKEHVDLTRLVGQAVESVSALQQASGQKMRVSAPPEAVFVRGDATRLEQVLVNLLSNAIKYTEAGGEIDVILTVDRNNACVRVRDNGSGISPELLPRIFDLFVQEDRALDRAQGGLGIGLTIVRRLVEMHGGRIDARSAGVDRGSEFEVVLPRIAPPQREESPVAPSALCEPRRIVVIEDQPDSAHMLAELLRVKSHEVMVAYDGTSGLELIRQWRPDLVLVDIGLPTMNGYEIAKRIRADVSLGNPTLIAITGYSQQADRERAQTSGFDHHLAKPVEPGVLDTLVATLTPANAV